MSELDPKLQAQQDKVVAMSDEAYNAFIGNLTELITVTQKKVALLKEMKRGVELYRERGGNK